MKADWDVVVIGGGHALWKGGAGWQVLRSLGIEPQGSSPPLGRYQALIGNELHSLPTSRDSLRRTTLPAGF
jgi:hypothetical protein